MSVCLIAFTVLSYKSVPLEQVYEKNPSWDLLLPSPKERIRNIYCCACCIFWLRRRLYFPVICSFDGTREGQMIILFSIPRYFTTGWQALQFCMEDAYPSVLQMFTCKWMDMWNEWIGIGRKSLRAQEKVITAVSRVDLRVITAATLV